MKEANQDKRNLTVLFIYLFYSRIEIWALGLCVFSCFKNMQHYNNRSVPAFYLSGNHTAQLFMGFVKKSFYNIIHHWMLKL